MFSKLFVIASLAVLIVAGPAPQASSSVDAVESDVDGVVQDLGARQALPIGDDILGSLIGGNIL